MNCEIINVGTELLTGSILNTNAQFLAQELSKLGFRVRNISVVGDNPKRLEETFKNSLKFNDLIVFSGGLGPTQDDLTKDIVAKVLNKKLIQDQSLVRRLKDWFKKRNLELTNNNLTQTFIIEDSVILNNPNGTACGLYLNILNKHIFLFPGPPKELKETYYLSALKILENLKQEKVISKYYNLTGIGESKVEDVLLDIIDNQTNPTIATYAKPGEILIRLTANGDQAQEFLTEKDKIIKERLRKYIFTYSDRTLLETVSNFLIDNKLTISTAESCTGGLLSEKFTSIPGISEVFLLGLVTYSNEAKQKLLNVNSNTLNEFGAVSKETCFEMCKNVRNILDTDIGVSTTGIAGPGGGTSQKPVGLVYTGLSLKDKIIVKENHFFGDRKAVQERTCNIILQMIRNELFSDY